MPLQPAAPEAQRILQLARRDRAAAVDSLRGLGLDAQVALVCELPVAAREQMLTLLPAPEQVIPKLPEAELCFTAKAVGLADAGWILEHATEEQLQACFDLDAWHDNALDPTALDAWLAALEDAGEETLVSGARSIDPELLYLYLRQHITARVAPNEDGWRPEPGEQTLEGQIYFSALREGEDLQVILRLLHGLFREDYWLYFRMMQAMSWETPAENEEYALRWRNGRLEDLGFPGWEEAMRIYGFLRPEQMLALPEEAKALSSEGWQLPVWMPRLPVALDAEHLVFRAAAALGDEERRAFFFALVSLANQTAVADRLPLGDAESIPTAIEKAAALSSRALELLARHHGMDEVEILRRVPVEQLFRIGANLAQESS